MTAYSKGAKIREAIAMDRVAEKANEIINHHVGFSLIAGAIPVPIADIMAVSVIQVDMVQKIAQAYDITYNKSYVKSLITSLTGRTFLTSVAGKSFLTSLSARSLAGIGASLLKTIPGVGTMFGVGSQAIISGASTYAVGKLFAYHFANNGTISNFDKVSLQEKYNDFYTEGKDYVSKIKANTELDDPLAALEKFNEMKRSYIF
ncbi:MAG: DUF697 domain-containing protein [Spirochaetota bacterium]